MVIRENQSAHETENILFYLLYQLISKAKLIKHFLFLFPEHI